MRVFVTGGSGFVGSHVVRHVAAGSHEVLVLVRGSSTLDRLDPGSDAVTFLYGDLSDAETIRAPLREFAPDVCVDCAWGELHSSGASATHVASLGNTLRLVELILEVGCPRYVHAGSCFEYAPSDAPLSEEDRTEPHTPYGACKLAASMTTRLMARRTGRLSVAWPRIFYVYGPHEAPGRLVPAVIRGLLGGQRTATTAGEQIRDYIHVEDVASALWTIACSAASGPVNVATGHAVSVREIVETIGRVLEREDLLDIGGLPYRADEPPVVRADASRLRALDWAPSRTLEQGLVQTIDWWRARDPDGGE